MSFKIEHSLSSQQVLQPSNSESNTPSATTMEQILPNLQVLQPFNAGSDTRNATAIEQTLPVQSTPNRPSNADNIIMLDKFCAQQRLRLNQTSALKSLMDFQKDAKDIILSNLSSIEKKTQLKACAHHKFEHRHYAPRLLGNNIWILKSML